MDKRLDGRIETLRRMRAAMEAKRVTGEFGEPEFVDGPPPITGEFGEITLADEPGVMEMDPLYIEGRVPKDPSMGVGEPQILSRTAKPQISELQVGEPEILSRKPMPEAPSPSKLTPEQVEVVNKFASERAKPMESAPKFTDIPQVSSEDRSRRMLEQARRQSSNDEGMAMIQQGGREIGDAIAGNKSDKWLYNTLSEQAQRPLAQLESDQAKSAAAATAKAKREQDVKEYVLKQMGFDRDAANLKADNERADKTFGLSESNAAESARHNRATEATSAADAASRAKKFKNTGGYGKKGEGVPDGSVPGLRFAPGSEPTKDDAKKMKASMASAGRMKRYVSELRELHKTHGTEYGGAVGNRMQQLSEAIKLEGKNISELGALSGPDMEIMNRLTGGTGGDPGGFWANVKGAFGSDNTDGALDGLEKWTTDQLGANKEAYGYEDDAPRKAPVNGQHDLSAAHVVETRTAPDGRKIELLSDGTKRIAQGG